MSFSFYGGESPHGVGSRETPLMQVKEEAVHGDEAFIVGREANNYGDVKESQLLSRKG